MPRSRSRSPCRSGFKWKDEKNRRRDRHEHRSSGMGRKSNWYGDKSSDREERRQRDRDYKSHGSKETPSNPYTEGSIENKTNSSKKGDSEENSAVSTAAAEPMIVVYVNDRLGTKAAIPCQASDPIKLFKAQVARQIGREPHEIMLKRQGERPFKDQLSLEDYGVSNGVQLDLEVDTGS